MSIIFDAVTKKFGESTVALDAVTFVVQPGEFIILTGPSGSGKTTLMRLLIHEYTPDAGEITFQDTRLSKLKSGQVPYHRRKIGVVFQDYKLLPELNIWENIALPLSIIGKDQEETESRVTDLLKLVSLETKAYLFPTQLSGGEAQRISIARALATGPSVIFADEPTGNLDPESSLGIIKLLRQINRLGTTVLLATHDMVVLDFLKNERRLILEHGKLTSDSHPKPLPSIGASLGIEEIEDEPVEITVTELTEVEVTESVTVEIEESVDTPPSDISPVTPVKKPADKPKKPAKKPLHPKPWSLIPSKLILRLKTSHPFYWSSLFFVLSMLSVWYFLMQIKCYGFWSLNPAWKLSFTIRQMN